MVLVCINFIIFFLQWISGKENDLFQLFGIVPKNIWSQFMVWQPFTYLFFHGSLLHVFMNMFMLWVFGLELEKLWGRKSFLKFYFLTGVGSGLVTLVFSYNSLIPVVGASGAVYGILIAYGLNFPNRIVLLNFLFPIKVKWLVIIWGAIAFFYSFGSNDNISHLTHLSGMVIGFFYLRFNSQWRRMIFSVRKQILEKKLKREENRQNKKIMLQKDVDHLLDRINQVGYDGLSDSEKSRLYAASRDISKEKKKD